MTLHDIQQFCKSPDNVTVDIKWEHDRVLALVVKCF